MFCRNCGKPVEEGRKFCAYCGAGLAGEQPSAQGPPSAPPARAAKQAGERSFLATPAGIILVAAVAVLVVAGVAVGLFLLLRGGPGTAGGAELAEVWDEYQAIADEADKGQARIDLDPSVLEGKREELEKTRLKVGELQAKLDSAGTPKEAAWKVKYDRLGGSIGYYDDFLRKLGDLYGTLAAGNLAVQIDAIEKVLGELADLADKARELADEFVEDNDAIAAGERLDPSVFETPASIASEVEKATGVTVSVEGGSSRDGAKTGDDVAQAQAALTELLSRYRSGGWAAITGDMSPALLQAYQSAPVPWDQVSYQITGADIEGQTVAGKDTIVFRVLVSMDDFGEPYSEYVDWEMVRSGVDWLVNNATNEYGESKL